MTTELYPHIVADPGILAGTPVIVGTNVSAGSVVFAIAAGKSPAEVAREYGVTAEDVRRALEFAARRAGEPIAPVPSVSRANSSDTTPPDDSHLAVEEARRLGLDPTRISPLGRRLLELRAEGIASGEPLLATWEELDAEIAERRGDRYPGADE